MVLLKYLLFFITKTWLVYSVNAIVDILQVSDVAIFEAGVEQTLVCVVTDGNYEDGIQWSVGDRSISTNTNVIENEKGKFQQTVAYIPIIEDDDAYLECRSGLEKRKVKLIIFLQKIIFTSWLEIKKDSRGEIFLTTQLYPPPTPQDVLWNIQSQTDTEIILRPGDEESGYFAVIIKHDDKDTYTFTLNIDNLTNDSLPTNISINITTLSKTKSVTFDLKQKPFGHQSLPFWIWICVGGVVCVLITSLVTAIITGIKMYRGEGDPIIGVRKTNNGYHRAANQFRD